MITRFRHIWLILTCLPGILLNRKKRALFAEAGAFLRVLPERFKRPLPELMKELTPPSASMRKPSLEKSLREIVDIAALINRSSPLGLCLRRSMTRYYFLRRAG